MFYAVCCDMLICPKLKLGQARPRQVRIHYPLCNYSLAWPLEIKKKYFPVRVLLYKLLVKTFFSVSNYFFILIGDQYTIKYTSFYYRLIF